MEYIGESSAIYYWRALGLIVSVLILYVVFEMQKKKMSRLSAQTACRQSKLFQQH